MNQKELSSLTDEELLQEAKKQRSAAITNAVIIGVLAGVIIYSIVKNSWGMLTLIPLFMIYKLVTGSRSNKDELENLLRERNLK